VSVRELIACWNVPSLLPSSTLTVLSEELATARSRTPSLLKSPVTTAWGFEPTS